MDARITYKDRIRSVLADSSLPMDIENIRVGAGLKNWESTKAILLEMVLQGTVNGEKTPSAWKFWINPSAKGKLQQK
jgi:hypothetical protein